MTVAAPPFTVRNLPVTCLGEARIPSPPVRQEQP
jgi:hypothetical protein